MCKTRFLVPSFAWYINFYLTNIENVLTKMFVRKSCSGIQEMNKVWTRPRGKKQNSKLGYQCLVWLASIVNRCNFMSQMKWKAILTWEFITDVLSWYQISKGRTSQDMFVIEFRGLNHILLPIFITDLLSMVSPSWGQIWPTYDSWCDANMSKCKYLETRTESTVLVF